MPRPKNFPGKQQTRISWNISADGAEKLRLAAIQLGVSPAAVMDRLIHRGLHLVLDGNQVGGDAPAPRKAPAPAKPATPRPPAPAAAGEPGATAWTTEALQEALNQLHRKRSELQAKLGLTNVDVWWSPPKHKGVPPSVPSRHWVRIDSILQEWGWVKPA